MIVYGRNLSPYARRVIIWARLQGHEVEQRAITPVEPEGFATLKEVNPSGRVPVVELDDGARLYESWAICDHLDSIAAPGARLLPSEPEARRAATQACGLANTIVEKGVALVYEGRRPAEFQWPEWRERLKGQITGPIEALEAITPPDGYFGGETPNGVDVFAVVAFDFIEKTNPDLLEGRAARLAALSRRANAAPVFSSTKP